MTRNVRYRCDAIQALVLQTSVAIRRLARWHCVDDAEQSATRRCDAARGYSGLELKQSSAELSLTLALLRSLSCAAAAAAGM